MSSSRRKKRGEVAEASRPVEMAMTPTLSPQEGSRVVEFNWRMYALAAQAKPGGAGRFSTWEKREDFVFASTCV